MTRVMRGLVCGIAGHKPSDIAPLFARASMLSNVVLAEELREDEKHERNSK